ncbi:MAG: WS/DGAT/MGAT family O-acyltransferase [Actinomycetota bacterium]
MTRERLSVLDASFLYLERGGVHMHVAGLVILDPKTMPDGKLRAEDLANLIQDRIHLVPRFRQKAVFPPLGLGRPVWVDDQDFDVDFHLRRAALPAPGGRKELADFVQRVHSRPLDRSKPLWEMYFIEGLEDGYVAVLSKTHHAMIDGISGMDIATVMFDLTPEPQDIKRKLWKPQNEPEPREVLIEAVRDQITHPLMSLADGFGRAIRAPQEAWDQAKRVLGGIGEIVAKGQAPQGPFNTRIGPNRRFSMAEVPVADAKAVKNALGGTVNDVVLAAVAGSLRKLLEHRGEKPTGSLRAMVPVSTRDVSKRMALGNQVSMFFADLPVGIADPKKRLEKISAVTKELKSSHQAIAATRLINTAQWTPPTLHGLAARLLARSRFANLVVSNVPGPQIPLYLSGAQLVVAYPVMPLGPALGLSVAVTSLSGTMGFGFTGDWDAVPDIDFLPEGLLESMAELKKAAGA